MSPLHPISPRPRRGRAVLVLGGAFNPIHTQHVALMCLVRAELEAQHGFQVLRGYFAVAPDDYVRGKGGDRGLPADRRIELCRLATREHDWLQPAEKPVFSAPRLAAELRRPGETGITVLGSDRVMDSPETARWRHRPRPGEATVCVGRAGDNQRVRDHYQADLAAGLVPDPDAFLFVWREVGAVSSSQIRDRLESIPASASVAVRRSVVRALVADGLLHDAVAEHLLAHEGDLLRPPAAG